MTSTSASISHDVSHDSDSQSGDEVDVGVAFIPTLKDSGLTYSRPITQKRKRTGHHAESRVAHDEKVVEAVRRTWKYDPRAPSQGDAVKLVTRASLADFIKVRKGSKGSKDSKGQKVQEVPKALPTPKVSAPRPPEVPRPSGSWRTGPSSRVSGPSSHPKGPDVDGWETASTRSSVSRVTTTSRVTSHTPGTKDQYAPVIPPKGARLCKWGAECRGRPRVSRDATAAVSVVPGKCPYWHPRERCTFGLGCRRTDCTYEHPIGFVTPSERRASVASTATSRGGRSRDERPCRDGAACRREGCKFAHPGKSVVDTHVHTSTPTPKPIPVQSDFVRLPSALDPPTLKRCDAAAIIHTSWIDWKKIEWKDEGMLGVETPSGVAPFGNVLGGDYWVTVKRGYTRPVGTPSLAEMLSRGVVMQMMLDDAFESDSDSRSVDSCSRSIVRGTPDGGEESDSESCSEYE